MIRGSFIGFFVGPRPRALARHRDHGLLLGRTQARQAPEEFGKGAIEGVAGPEAANNAAVGGAFVPLMALGIPFTPAMAVIMAVLLIHGISPGPLLISDSPTSSGA